MILGFGTIGIFHSIIARKKELNVVIVDNNNFRLEFGKQERLAKNFVNISDSDFRGFGKFYEKIDLCIIANSDVLYLNEAIKVVRKGGTILFFGEPKANATVSIDFSEIYFKEIRIISSYSAINLNFQL